MHVAGDNGFPLHLQWQRRLQWRTSVCICSQCYSYVLRWTRHLRAFMRWRTSRHPTRKYQRMVRFNVSVRWNSNNWRIDTVALFLASIPTVTLTFLGVRYIRPTMDTFRSLRYTDTRTVELRIAYIPRLCIYKNSHFQCSRCYWDVYIQSVVLFDDFRNIFQYFLTD